VAVAYTTATAYVASIGAKARVSHANKTHADLVVDVVNTNASHIVGGVVYGTGTLTLGNATYAVKTAYGTAVRGDVKLTLYTGNAIILLQYKHGRYFAVVKPLGRPGVERFGGKATLKIQ